MESDVLFLLSFAIPALSFSRLCVQVNNSDMKYRKMGIIGTLKIVSTLGNINGAATFSSSQVGFK